MDGGGSETSEPECYTCVLCEEVLVETPRQAPCGERLCSPCWRGQRNRGEDILCPKCGDKIILEKCFPDRALQQELTSLVLRCGNEGCTWKGPLNSYIGHRKVCGHQQVKCVNAGCEDEVKRDDREEHEKTCVFAPVPCEWCSKPVPRCHIEEHVWQVCDQVMVSCPQNCGGTLMRGKLTGHYQTDCTEYVRDCCFRDVGCSVKGNSHMLSAHNKECIAEHLSLMKSSIDKSRKEVVMELEELEGKLNMLSAHKELEELEGKLKEMKLYISECKKSSDAVNSEFVTELQSLTQSVKKWESAIQQLQDGFGEVALLVQTLQATSYSGVFVWKIPEVTRRRHEAMNGRTLSLYSAPFYTSRHGYKLCLRLYMAGDGIGKGTHLSFFLTVMRGDFDSLLRWPFRQTVSLMMLDQDRQRDIVQSFRPEPTSASFQRPRLEMNVASGCPMFAALSMLDNPSYVKEDTLFLKCIIDRNGLDAY